MTASPTNCVTHDSDTENFLNNFVHGAIAGDFAENTGWGGVAGQTMVGFVPVVGQVADVRDTVAAGAAFGNGGWQKWGTYVSFAAVAVAWIPGMDWVKGGKKAASETIQSTSKVPLRELVTSADGRLKGLVPDGVPKQWDKNQIEDAIDAVKDSLQTRRAEALDYKINKSGGDKWQEISHDKRIVLDLKQVTL